MNEVQINEKLRLLEQEIALAGDATETLRLEMRAEIDALRLENEVLKRCLQLIHPEMQEHFAALRADVIHETNPETQPE
jgi:hypothetical protein